MSHSTEKSDRLASPSVNASFNGASPFQAGKLDSDGSVRYHDGFNGVALPTGSAKLQWGLALSGGETAFTPRITSSIVASWCVSRNIGLHLAVHRACTSSLDQNQPLKMRALQAIRYHHRTSRIWSETRGS